MFTLLILSLLVLIGIAMSVYLFRAREQVMNQLILTNAELIEAKGRNRLLEEQEQVRKAAKDDLAEAFKGLASNALQGSMDNFLKLAQSSFTQAQELSKSESDQRHQAMDALIKPVGESLAQYQEQIRKLELERQRAFQTIDVELKKVSEAHGHLARETTALKDALKKPHVRGRWGEVQLRNCIELAGMSEHSDVQFQNFSSDETGARHIPDMVVRMPGGRQVIVDSKTPIDAFLNSLEATTEEARHAEMVRHGRHVKDHVRNLAKRNYPESLKGTADFTVMFLPNESFLYAALEMEPDIVEFALEKKILIATPPTLIGLLKVIRYGWNEQRMAENAQAISEIATELHKRLCEFVEGYSTVGKHLDKARDEFEKGKNRLQSRVIAQARKFETLGVKSSKELGDEGMLEIAAPE